MSHKDGDINYETEKENKIEKILIVNLLQNNNYVQNLNIFKAANEIHRSNKLSSEKNLIDNISKRLGELEFKSNHFIKLKCLRSL